MQIEKVSITSICQYFGHQIKKNKLLELKLKFAYEERVNMAQMLLLVGQDISLFVRQGKGQILKVGEFNFGGLAIDRDGEGVIKLSADVDYVEHANLMQFIGSENLLKIRLVAEIELEDEDE